MKSTAARQSTVLVTPTAASLLAQLATRYRQPLKFRVFAGGFDCPMLRIHGKDYPGDVLLEVAGAGVALCPGTFHSGLALHVHCVADPAQRSKLEVLLSVNKRLTTILPLEQIVARIQPMERPLRAVGTEYSHST